jgi:UDP:flavonoid glycosyltransferase YjiC (YdhE family)
MGLPSIIVPIADNQVSVARALAAAGAALVLSPDAVEDGRLVEATTRLLADSAALRRMAAAAAAITDGSGVVATCRALREER